MKQRPAAAPLVRADTWDRITRSHTCPSYQWGLLKDILKGSLWGQACPLTPPPPPGSRKTNPRRVQSYLLDISVTAGEPAHRLGAARLPISAQWPVSFPLTLIQLQSRLPHPSPCPYQPTVRPALFYLTFKFRSCHQRIRSRLDEWTRGSG